jgi:hypothetical protein
MSFDNLHVTLQHVAIVLAKETMMSAMIFILLCLSALLLFMLPDERVVTNDE